jgi:integrase
VHQADLRWMSLLNHSPPSPPRPSRRLVPRAAAAGAAEQGGLRRSRKAQQPLSPRFPRPPPRLPAHPPPCAAQKASRARDARCRPPPVHHHQLVTHGQDKTTQKEERSAHQHIDTLTPGLGHTDKSVLNTVYTQQGGWVGSRAEWCALCVCVRVCLRRVCSGISAFANSCLTGPSPQNTSLSDRTRSCGH